MPTASASLPELRLGIDLGGTKIEIVALDAAGRERLRHRVATPVGDYDATLGAIVELVRDAERELGARCPVGVGTPGTIGRNGLIRGSNSACLNGRPIGEDLGRMLGRTVAIDNDANCFALSEVTDGAASGADVAFGVILGTGVGGGLCIGGRPIRGANGIAGEWGHNPLPWADEDERPGPRCYCGQRGCIETFLSGPGFVRDHAERSGTTLAAEAIVAAAAAGEPAAARSLRRYEERLARALAHVINIVDPQAIVLGGGMSNVDSLYTTVPAMWGRWVFADEVDTRLLRNVHGDSSGVRGAARL